VAMELDTADPTSDPSILLPDIEPWLDPVDKDLQLKKWWWVHMICGEKNLI